MTDTKTTVDRIATITAGASLSTVIDKSHYTRMLIIMPAAWTAADIRFQVSDNLTTGFVPLRYGVAGTEVIAKAEAGVAIGLDGAIGEAIAAAPFVKISSESDQGVAVTQTPGRKFIIILSRW